MFAMHLPAPSQCFLMPISLINCLESVGYITEASGKGPSAGNDSPYLPSSEWQLNFPRLYLSDKYPLVLGPSLIMPAPPAPSGAKSGKAPLHCGTSFPRLGLGFSHHPRCIAAPQTAEKAQILCKPLVFCTLEEQDRSSIPKDDRTLDCKLNVKPSKGAVPRYAQT